MNLDRLTALWQRVRDSLWFLPALLTLGAGLLAVLTIRLDVAGVLGIGASPGGGDEAAPGTLAFAFTGTADGARSVLNAIAAGLITVTGVVFSVTIVALQLASTQFTPRILRAFTADRGNQLVLGVFIATFTYALLIQRVVRGENSVAGGFVPHLSVTVALALALVSIGFLIYFIDHAAKSVQAAVIIDRAANDALHRIRVTLEDLSSGGEVMAGDVAPPRTPGRVVPAGSSGFVQGVDRGALLELLGGEAEVIRIEPHIGDFLQTGAPLATVWPGPAEPDGDLVAAIREAFVLGYERTPHMDVELRVVELVDIAVKALSPAINDPTTAMICLDRLSEIVAVFGRCDPAPVAHRHPESGGTLLMPRPEFAHMVETAFDQIRHFGAENPHFATTLMRRLDQVGRLVPPDRHPPLRRQAEALLREARRHGPDPVDASRLEDAAREAFATLGGPPPPPA